MDLFINFCAVVFYIIRETLYLTVSAGVAGVVMWVAQRNTNFFASRWIAYPSWGIIAFVALTFAYWAYLRFRLLDPNSPRLTPQPSP